LSINAPYAAVIVYVYERENTNGRHVLQMKSKGASGVATERDAQYPVIM
jgi:hypothetical protein